MKRGEKAAKSLMHFKNTDFSCQHPDDYYKRLLDNIKNNLFDQN